jgi:prolyl oligopeptidase
MTVSILFKKSAAVCMLAVAACAAAQVAPASTVPLTPATPVTDDYFGTQVVDPYRWMENMKSDIFRNWAKAQADYADGVLARIPGRDALKKRLTELADASENIGAIDSVGGTLFYLKSEPGRDARRLFLRDAKGNERLLLDPEAMDAQGTPGSHHAIDFFSPSPDGRLLAIGISQGGSEDSTLRVMDIASGGWLSDAIDGAGLNHGGVGWRPNGRSFFYNRLPPADKDGHRERYNKSVVHEHVIGQPASNDKAIFGYGVTVKRHFAVPDLPYVFTSPDSNYALAIVLHGDAVDRSFYVAPLSAVNGADTPWRKIVAPEDQVNMAYLHGSQLFLLSHKNAPRYQLLALDLTEAPKTAAPSAHAQRRSWRGKVVKTSASVKTAGAPVANAASLTRAKVVIARGDMVLRGAAVAKDALYVHALDGGVGRLLRVPFDGKPVQQVALPFDGTVREMATDPLQPGALVKLEGWTESPRIYTVDAAGMQVVDSGLLKPATIDFSGIEAKRVMVKSQDGTLVPLSIIHKKGIKLDGSNPAILNGYGAYGITLEPRFVPGRLAWLERGGVFAVAHVRGGGEFGEEWHMGAHILNKANTIRDFIACAEYLIKEGYTSPKKLAGTGGSAGGLTIGGAITQRPELFAAAQNAVGLSDMLRMELTPNGPPNIAEFGTVTKKDQFEAMYAISPYHRVQDGVAYPATIVTTGMNDPRVEAWLPAKFAARLQTATASGKPVLLRIDYDAGHGMGSTRAQSIAETADVWSFFLWQMGDPAFQPAK